MNARLKTVSMGIWMGTKCFKMQQMVALCSSLVSILPEEEEEGGRGGSSAEPLPSVVFCLSENSSTGLFGLLSLRGSFCFITRPLVVLFLSSRSVRGLGFFWSVVGRSCGAFDPCRECNVSHVGDLRSARGGIREPWAQVGAQKSFAVSKHTLKRSQTPATAWDSTAWAKEKKQKFGKVKVCNVT